MLLVEAPLDHLLPSESATLISLATMWVNILLRKAVKIKHLSWAYVLRILNNEAANTTFDELFEMTVQSSREDVATQVFSSVLQNESLQHELFNFLKAFAQTCIARGGAVPLQDLKVTISSDIMETSGLKAEFESLMKGEYERVMTTTDSLGGPPHLTAHLTVLVDAANNSEKLSGQSLEDCSDRHTPRAANRGKSAAMEELQCPTHVTSTTNGTASIGSIYPCTHAVEHANKKPQALKKDPGIDKTSNTAYDQNHGDVPKFESSTTVSLDGKLSGHSNGVNQSLENCKAQLTPHVASTSIGSKYPCTHAVERVNKKPQALKKDSEIEYKTSNVTDDQNNGDVPKLESSLMAQPKPVENTYSKPQSRFADIQDGSLNSSTTGAETEIATSSCMYSGVAQNLKQPHSVRKETNHPCEEPATLHSESIHSSSSLHPHFLLPLRTISQEELLWHVKQPVTQETVLTQIPKAKRENGNVPSISNEMMLSSPTSEQSQPHSWRTNILRNCANLASLKHFIQSLPPEVLTLKDAEQGKTLCHTLVSFCVEGFTSSDIIHLLELFEEHFLQQCMTCQDCSGNTPLHYVVHANHDIVKFLLRFTSCESLLILNEHNWTPLELSFENNCWLITQMLIDHQIETGTSCAAEILQQYILKAAIKDGGANLLSHLLDMRECYCPDLDLNFGSSESSRTPWWYLVNSTNEVFVMNRVLQALKDHSIEFESLLTRTEGKTNFVEEAMEKNETLFKTIQRVAGWVHSEEDLGAPNKEGLNTSGSSDLVEEAMEKNINRIAQTPPGEEDHIAPDEERFNVDTLPQQQTPSCSSKIASEQSSSDPQFEQVQFWLSQCDGEGSDCHMSLADSSSDQHEFPRRSSTFSSGKEAGGQGMPNTGKTVFRQPKTALFRNISSSESEVEYHKFGDPAQRSFQAVAGDEERELPLDKIPSETYAMHVQQQSFETTTELPHPGDHSNMELQPIQAGSLTPLSTELPKGVAQSSSESFSEGGGTSVEADDSSDGSVSGGTLTKTKRRASQAHRKCKKTIQVVQSVPHVISKGKKSSLVVLHQRSGYSGDDSDHRNECIKMKSSRFTRAQRAAGIVRKEQLCNSSTSECSEGEIDEQHSAQILNTKDAVYDGTRVIELKVLSTVCKVQLLNSTGNLLLMSREIGACSAQIWDTEDAPCDNTYCISLLNSTDCLSQMSSSTPDLRKSTELHHAVRRQCLQSVKHILTCDGGEDLIQTVDRKGYTPLEIASQSRDLMIFELLLENLVRSQSSRSVTLPPCSGHQQVTLMTSIVKVLSKLEIEFCPSTLRRIMLGCHHWELPMVVHVTPTAVLTTIVLLGELLWTYRNQTVMDELFSCLRGGIRKKKSIKSSQEQTTQEQTTQEQKNPFQSEMVSDTREFDILHFYRSAGINSLVTGVTLTRSKGFESHQRQTRTSTGTHPYQPNHPSNASAAGKTPSSTNPTPSPETTRSTLPLVAADSPSYSQPKSPATTPKQVSKSTDVPLDKDSDVVTAWQAWIEKAVDCLHAGYYSQMLEVLKFGKVPPSLPPKIPMEAQFGCALAYYKLDKHNEAAKHLESLKTIASSAQSFGNESIASVYLGDIEFTQSRYTEAAKHYSHALELYQGDDNIGKEYKLIVPTFSAVSAKLGSAFRNASKVVDAVQAYRRAIATADSKKDELSAHTSLGNLFQSVGENASALAEYEHSIRLSEELKDHVSLGWAYGNMGNAYLGLYQREKGLNYLTKALDLTVKHEPTPQAISRAYNNLGTAHQALNELDKAEENYDLALGQSIYGNDIPGQARVYGNIGNVLMLRKDYERSIPHYTEVLHLSKDRSTVSTAFHNRGCSYYEWAESKKETLFPKDASSVKKDQFFLNGPDFKGCEGKHQPPLLPNSILKYYQQGRQDLEEVVKYHEETFDNIKGSSKGLTLSVSLFETNSRTFHRLQDCLVNLREWEMALVVAEQSRTRTLGELLVKRKGWQIDHPLTTPLNLETISDVVKSQHSIVVYLSYTGARLLGWVLAPKSSKISASMFEVPLEDDQFEGKSFDYHLRYNLTEVLVERSFEMYRAVDYQSELNEPVRKLYRLFGRPLMKIFKELEDPDSTPGVQDIVIVPDSYTNLLPFPCLLADEEDGGGFLGDSFDYAISSNHGCCRSASFCCCPSACRQSKHVCCGESNNPNIHVQW